MQCTVLRCSSTTVFPIQAGTSSIRTSDMQRPVCTTTSTTVRYAGSQLLPTVPVAELGPNPKGAELPIPDHCTDFFVRAVRPTLQPCADFWASRNYAYIFLDQLASLHYFWTLFNGLTALDSTHSCTSY
jgi:hypothetical protein